jgi:hypothetical protein
MLKKKYVLANIIIPIEIKTKEKNKLVPLTEYVKIDITKCDILPDKSSNDYTIMEKIKQLFSDNEPSVIDDSVLLTNIEDGIMNIVDDSESETESIIDSDSDIETDTDSENEKENDTQDDTLLTISLNEILNKKPKSQYLNTSFKNKPKICSRYTIKNYNAII